MSNNNYNNINLNGMALFTKVRLKYGNLMNNIYHIVN